MRSPTSWPPTSRLTAVDRAQCAARTAAVPFISALDGKRHPGTDMKPNHWRNCIEGPNRLAAAVDAHADRPVDVFLEIGLSSLGEEARRVLADKTVER